jgi:type IV pilus assembly protein PilA
VKKFRTTAQAQEDGFTLAELMVVVLIIGILALTAIASYRSITARAAEAACLANQRTLYSALNVYSAEMGEFPTATNLDFLQGYANTWDFISVCPLDKSPLTFDSVHGLITCPNHPFNN